MFSAADSIQPFIFLTYPVFELLTHNYKVQLTFLSAFFLTKIEFFTHEFSITILMMCVLETLKPI